MSGAFGVSGGVVRRKRCDWLALSPGAGHPVVNNHKAAETVRSCAKLESQLRIRLIGICPEHLQMEKSEDPAFWFCPLPFLGEAILMRESNYDDKNEGRQSSVSPLPLVPSPLV